MSKIINGYKIVDGVFEAGAATLPALRFITDLDTGLYSVSANVMGVAVGGAQVGKWEAGGFRTILGSAATPSIAELSGLTGMYFPSATSIAWSISGASKMELSSAGNLGIGTSPTNILHMLRSQNSATEVILSNVNTGAAARAQYKMISDGGNTYFGVGSVASAFAGGGFFYTDAALPIAVYTNNLERLLISGSAANGGNFTFTQGINTSGSPTAFKFISGAHTTLATTVESIGVDFDLDASKGWSAGVVSTQREFLIRAPNYTGATFTNAATFAITGAPSGTITNPYAFWVQAGKSLISSTPLPAVTAALRNTLHIVDNTTNATVSTENTATTGYSGFEMFDATAAKTASAVWSNSAAAFLPGSFWVGTRTASSMHFVINTLAKMSIDSAGLVGINTQANSIAHGDLLHIYNTGTTYSGTLLQRNANTSIAAFRFRTGASTDDFLLGMRGTSDSDFHIYNYGTSADILNIARTTGITSFSYRVNQKQGTDVASASTIALGNDGNTFEITGTTAVNLITSTGWQNGSKVTLIANENVTINNGTATSGSDITIKLAGAANFGMTANDTLTLVLSETTAGSQAWREISRSAN